MTPAISKFISLKKAIATCLVPVFLVLSVFSLGHWFYESFFSFSKIVTDIKDINKIFFDDFFTILILVDVMLLLFSFLHSDKFNIVIRNSGFIISTILIKLSFSTEGIMNIVLIVTAVVFGVALLKIHNQFEKI
jgi:NADH:ubiquinone oxidoreductase subunit 6 (subunit J)